MPKVLQIVEHRSELLRVVTGAPQSVPAGQTILIRSALVLPDARYRPPTGSDRWGARDDLDRDLGSLVLSLPDLHITLGSTLALMDAYWRLHHIEEHAHVLGVREVLDALGRDAKARGDAHAVAAGLGLAGDAWAAYYSEVIGPARLGKPLVLAQRQAWRMALSSQDGGTLDCAAVTVEIGIVRTVPVP